MLARGDIVLVAFISSNTAGPPADDELDIPAEHPEFAESGLKVSSRLRITRMTTLSAQLIRRRIGVFPLGLRTELQDLLRRAVFGAGPE